MSKFQHVYKIETVGGEYVCAAGVPNLCEAPACALTAFAVEARELVVQQSWSTGSNVKVKMGMHSGSVVAGISGSMAPRYRLFGDTVNTASRMKSQAANGQIIASQQHIDRMQECCANAYCDDGKKVGAE